MCIPASCPIDASLETIRAQNPVGVILSGGPASVLEQDAPRCDEGVYQLGVPVLGICYGMQLTAYLLGGTVEKAAQREYGRITVTMDDKTSLLSGMSDASSCWLSHTYQVKKCPAGFHPIAHSTNCPVAAMANDDRRIYGVQFHPEVTHSDEGRAVIENFLYICGCVGDWSMETYAQTAIANIREIVGDKGTVLLGLSGGVDSSVAAALIYKAIGDRLTCVYVDHGFMRKGETEQVVNVFTHTFPVRLVASDASKIFYEDLKGVSDPETKRKIIGRDFLKVFKAESEKLGKLDYFAQGNDLPGRYREWSGDGRGGHQEPPQRRRPAQGARLHAAHRAAADAVQGRSARAGRNAWSARTILVWRQPFPGPGLAIRVIGDADPVKRWRLSARADAVAARGNRQGRSGCAISTSISPS